MIATPPPDDNRFILSLLATRQSRQIQQALQLVAWNAHRGRRLSRELWQSLVQSLPALLRNQNVKVRRWTYVTIALIRPRPLPSIEHERLIEAIHDRIRAETDPENRLWAFTALFSLIEEADLRTHLARAHPEFGHLRLQMAYRITHSSTPTLLGAEDRFGRVLSTPDDVALWQALVHGYSPPPFTPIGPEIAELTKHNDARVSEYAIWSLVHHPDAISALVLADTPRHLRDPPNVRRWFYQLLAATRPLPPSNEEVLIAAMSHEPDATAREGLALAVEHVHPTDQMVAAITDWYVRETDTTVLLALLRHVARNADSNPQYFTIIVDAAAEDNRATLPSRLLLETLRATASPSALTHTTISPSRATTERIHMNIERSIVNFGTMRDATLLSLERLDSAEHLSHRRELTTALRAVVEAAGTDPSLSDDQRRDIVEYVERLATTTLEAPTAPDHKKNVVTAFRSLLGLLHDLPNQLPTVTAALEALDKVRTWVLA